MSTARAAAALALLGAACMRTPRTTQRIVPAASSSFVAAPYAPVRGEQPRRTEDGIVVLAPRAKPPAREGDIAWVPPAYRALDPFPEYEACDGESIYLAVGRGASVLVRDGEVHLDPLAALGVREGGCGAARRGELLLSGVAPGSRDETVAELGPGGRRKATRKAAEQVIVRIGADGRQTTTTAPELAGTEARCRAILGDHGDFALMLFGPVEFDGQAFVVRKDQGLGWYAGRTLLGKPFGPRFCFQSCNATEEAETHPLTARLLEAIDHRDGPYPTWVALGDRVAGVRRGRAVRATTTGGEIEVVDGVPESKMLSGSMDAAFTAAGDVVIGLDYHFKRYVVWRADAKELTPVRVLAEGEFIANASPTALVRLPSPMPASDTFAVVVGKDIGVGTGGPTYGYDRERRGIRAHKARFDRARKVLSGRLFALHDAIVDSDCGGYVRSPLGWEGELIFDWRPPTLPALFPAAVTKTSPCLALSKLGALPGDPDLLLGVSGGELFAAWLPPPLPLAAGWDPRRPRPTTPDPVQHPRAGTGWMRVGPVDDVVAEPAVAEPGGDPSIADGTWQAAGGAVLKVGSSEILITKRGAVTLPPGTRPMAIGQTSAQHVWGAVGAKVVECRATCRTLDPKVPAEIVAVVPRSEARLAIGYADGRVGAYEVPESGGVEVAQHPLAAALGAVFARRPTEP